VGGANRVERPREGVGRFGKNQTKDKKAKGKDPENVGRGGPPVVFCSSLFKEGVYPKKGVHSQKARKGEGSERPCGCPKGPGEGGGKHRGAKGQTKEHITWNGGEEQVILLGNR